MGGFFFSGLLTVVGLLAHLKFGTPIRPTHWKSSRGQLRTDIYCTKDQFALTMFAHLERAGKLRRKNNTVFKLSHIDVHHQASGE